MHRSEKSYSIASYACASSAVVRSLPSALAVLRLIIRSNLVGNSRVNPLASASQYVNDPHRPGRPRLFPLRKVEAR